MVNTLSIVGKRGVDVFVDGVLANVTGQFNTRHINVKFNDTESIVLDYFYGKWYYQGNEINVSSKLYYINGVLVIERSL